MPYTVVLLIEGHKVAYCPTAQPVAPGPFGMASSCRKKMTTELTPRKLTDGLASSCRKKITELTLRKLTEAPSLPMYVLSRWPRVHVYSVRKILAHHILGAGTVSTNFSTRHIRYTSSHLSVETREYFASRWNSPQNFTCARMEEHARCVRVAGSTRLEPVM